MLVLETEPTSSAVVTRVITPEPSLKFQNSHFILLLFLVICVFAYPVGMSVYHALARHPRMSDPLELE